MNTPVVIAIGGYARTGKDTMYEVYARFARELNVPCKKLKFADALKEEVRQDCLDLFGIDSFTEDPEEKEIIRPVLVKVGKARRLEDEDYWARTVLNQPMLPGFNIITDLRFENELFMLKDIYPNCKVLILDKPGIGPVNSEEDEKTSPLYRTPYVYKWSVLSGKPWEFMSSVEQDEFFHGVIPTLTF